MAAQQALPSLGFSRQEYWSGLPFPSPMHESEKWKWSHSVMSDSLRPHGLQPTRLICPWDFPGKSTGVGLPLPSLPWTIQSMKFSRPEYWSGYPFPSPGDLLNPGIEPRSPVLQADSLPAEPQGKPKNTGVDSLSLLQQTFQTQELNWDLLHCR